jgi:hypothetical protein
MQCVSGYLYPTKKKLPIARARKLTIEIYEYLFQHTVAPYPHPYPRIFTLLALNTADFLRILCVTFDELSLGSKERLTSITDALVSLMIDKYALD